MPVLRFFSQNVIPENLDKFEPGKPFLDSWILMGLNKIEREINPQTSYYPWHTAPTDHSNLNISYYPSIHRQTPIQAFLENWHDLKNRKHTMC